MDRILNTLLLGTAIVAMALSAAADYVREDELTVRTAVQGWSASQQTIDLRKAFTVSSLEDEALRGLMYSANGWERDAAGDASRTVAITAQAGTLANGVFTPDGSAEMTVATGLGGEGTVDWALTEISKKVYRLKHAVRKDGAPVGVADLYGYLDFTHCLSWASQSDVEAAVLGEFTHGIAVTQDADSPWQPIDSTVVRSGLMTDGEWLEPGDVTVTAFAFGGRGVLHYEYDLTGGELAVVADGKIVMTFTEPKSDFVPCQVSFDGYGAHELSFVYTAVGGGNVAAIRNVRWVKPDRSSRTAGADADIRVDLQAGEVRTPKKFEHVLPFVYSPTNFTGTVDGKSSRVSIVQLEGTVPDVTTWAEVPGTWRKLKEATDEGEVRWRAKKGVWKATFEIFDGPTLKETQIKYFDLRNAKVSGIVIFIT